MSVADGLKAAALLLVAALLQVTIVTPISVAQGHADVVLVALVAIAILRGPLLGAAAGFFAGLVLDLATLETLGLSSLLLTLAGYWAGRFGEATTKSSSHPPLIAVALATPGVLLASAVLHFMLGQTIAVSHLLVGILLPSLALNLLLAYPVYRLCRRVFRVPARERREVSLAV